MTSITSFTNTYTNDTKKSFVVIPVPITFSVTTDQIVSYEWLLNKVPQINSTDSYTFNIPNEKNIWEIYLRVYNVYGEAYIKWIITTLSLSEAPDFIEYFVDGKYNSRTETDPWERSLMNWTARSGTPITNRLMLYTSSTTYTLSHTLNNQTYGTWKFKKMFPEVGNSAKYTEVRMQPTVGTNQQGYSSAMGFHDAGDAHDRFWVLDGSWGNLRGYYWHDSGIYPLRAIWTTVTIIHTPDGMWYYYEDDVLKWRNWCGTDPALSNYLDWMMMSNNTPPKNIVMADGFEAYKDRYIFPSNSISYKQYMDNAHFSSVSGYIVDYKTGIVIDKRSATLQDIANEINDTSLFTYDAQTRTAHCYTNLVVGYSGELNIDNETIIIYCAFNGQYDFGTLFGATLRINNSIIKSYDTNYFIFHSTSTSHFGYPASVLKSAQKFDARLSFASFSTLEITNSTIDNFAYMFLDDVHELVIKDSILSNLHHDIDTGNYTTSDTGLTTVRRYLQGKKSFWLNIKHGIDTDLAKFEMKNVTFTGADTSMETTVIIDQWHDKLNLYDINFNGNLNTKKSLKVHSAWEGINSDYDLSKFGLVNCLFNNINITSDNSEVDVKYYLDIKVVDNNNIVSGATITVTNEIDDINFPSENIKNEWYKQTVKTGKTNTGYFSYKNFDTLKTTISGINGHTPLPSDEINTLILTSYKKTNLSTTNYTYTITASTLEKTATINGFSIDNTWYRTNPLSVLKYLVFNIDTGAVYIEVEGCPTPICNFTITQT